MDEERRNTESGTQIPGDTPGRVSPQDLDGWDEIEGCGLVVPHNVIDDEPGYTHVTAVCYVVDCEDCRALLYASIASRVEEQTIARASAVATCGLRLTYGADEPEYVSGRMDAVAHVLSLPRLYSSPKGTEQ